MTLLRRIHVERHETKITDGTLSVQDVEGWLTVGNMEHIYELLDGETYTIEYDETQRKQLWLDTDASGELTVDVRDTIVEMSFDEDFVTRLAGTSVDERDDSGYPLRTRLFVDQMTDIWDSKGQLDD